MKHDLFAPPPELEPARPSRLQDDLECARRADEPSAVDAAREAFLASAVGQRLAARLEAEASRRELQRRRARRTRLWMGGGALAVAASFALIFALGVLGTERAPDGGTGELPGLRGPGEPEPGQQRGLVPYDRDVAAKGGSALAVFRKRGEEVAPVVDGALLQAGDRLRFTYRTTRRYLLVVDLEARGGVSSFYPYPAVESLRLTGERGELPGSIELNESVGAERVLALFSDAPLRFEAVAAAVERAYPRDDRGERELGAERPLGLDADVVSLRFHKRAGRGR